MPTPNDQSSSEMLKDSILNFDPKTFVDLPSPSNAEGISSIGPISPKKDTEILLDALTRIEEKLDRIIKHFNIYPIVGK